MQKTRLVLNLVVIGVLGGSGLFLAKTNNSKLILSTEKQVRQTKDSLAQIASPLDTNTSRFNMPKYDERAMQMQQQQMMLEQMTPSQRQQYMQQYQAYMQQMAMQEEMIRQQKEYERQIRQNGGIPPVSDKTQSKIEKLKAEFERKRIQDSIANAKKLPNLGSF
jgi:uncharacterized membrane protein YeiB